MRPLLVVLAAKAIEGALLRAADCAAGGIAVSCFSVRCMRSCRPFCSGCPACDALRRECPASSTTPTAATARQRPRGKRRAVVGADRLRHPVLAKRRFEDRLHPLGVGLLHRLAAQQVAAVRVGDGQRIDACAIAGAKPALEVGAPDPVGPVGRGERLRVGRNPPPLACARITNPSRASIVADGARRRPLLPRLLAAPALASAFADPTCMCARRNSSTACSIASGVWLGCRRGARLWSRNPSTPSAR